LPVAFLFALGMYALFLTENIFSVAVCYNKATMTESETLAGDISSEITEIRRRLRSSATVREAITFSKEVSEEERLRQIIKQHQRLTAVARSEFFASSENLRSLLGKVKKIRDWLFDNDNGKDFTSHPDYQEWIKEEWRTPRELERLYWYRDKRFSVNADESELKETKDEFDGYKLFLSTEDPHEQIGQLLIIFGWDATFELEIFLPERYSSSRLSLEKMTPEEAKIIDYYLDQFLQFHSSQE